MLSRSLKIALAVCVFVGLLVGVVATNARLSWRPVLVDLQPPGMSTISPPPYLPLAWRDQEMWLLGHVQGGPVFPTQQTLPLRTLRNWNHAPHRLICTVHSSETVALCSALGLMARAEDDGRIDISRNGSHIRTIQEDRHRSKAGDMVAGPHYLMAWSPDGTRLVTESGLAGFVDHDEKQRGFCAYGAVLFDGRNGRQITRQSAFEGCFSDFAWSPNSQEVAGITVDGWVLVLDGKSGKLRLKFRAHQLFGAQIAWSPDGKTLVTATNPRVSWSQVPLRYDFKSGTGIMLTASSGTTKLAFGNASGKHIIVQKPNGDTTFDGRTERQLKRFDARTGRPIGTALALQTGAVDLAFSPDGRQLALGEHNFAMVLDANTLANKRRLTVPLRLPPNANDDPVCVTWSPDGNTLATSTWRGIWLWRMR